MLLAQMKSKKRTLCIKKVKTGKKNSNSHAKPYFKDMTNS